MTSGRLNTFSCLARITIYLGDPDSLHFVHEPGSLSWFWVRRLADISLVIPFQWSPQTQHLFLREFGILPFSCWSTCCILPFADCDSLSPKSNILLFLSSTSCCSLLRTTNLPIEAPGITCQGESPASTSSPSTFSSPFTHFLCASCVEMFSPTFRDHCDWGICTTYALPRTLCPFVKTRPSWEWRVLLRSPLVVVLNFCYFRVSSTMTRPSWEWRVLLQSLLAFVLYYCYFPCCRA